MLFGLEQQWSAELAKYYGTTSPDWYSGSSIGAFDVASFSTSIAAFSAFSAASSSSGGSSSGFSSSGGSGGCGI